MLGLLDFGEDSAVSLCLGLSQVYLATMWSLCSVVPSICTIPYPYIGLPPATSLGTAQHVLGPEDMKSTMEESRKATTQSTKGLT